MFAPEGEGIVKALLIIFFIYSFLKLILRYLIYIR